MKEFSKGLAVVVRALDELPEAQREVYRARYVQEEEREITCARLGLAPARYDEILRDVMRSLRRMISRSHSQTVSV